MCVVCFSYFSDRDLCCFKQTTVQTPSVATTPASSFHSNYSGRELIRINTPPPPCVAVRSSRLPTSQSLGSDIVGKKLARLDYALI